MKTSIIAFLLLVINSAMSGQNVLNVGDKVPDFSAPADDGSTWNVRDFVGKDFIVIYFYPGAMTTGCTKQACSYRDHQSDLRGVDAVVVGISGDRIENLKLFKQAENLNFTLLSDVSGAIAGSFGVPVGEGAVITRTVFGTEHELTRDVTARRWTFIIGKEGKIIYKNEAVDAEKDTEEVLAFLKQKEGK